MQGEELARRIHQMIEYAPRPPLRNGTPAAAGPARTALTSEGRKGMDRQARLAAEQAGMRLGIQRQRA